MKLIHCGDIHLDSPMQASLPEEKSRERRQEILRSFLQLIDLAAERQVDAFLICGDLFDSPRPSLLTLSTIFAAMEEHREIDFLYLPGNHDPLNAPLFQGAPENFHLFTDTPSSFRYGDAVITGVALTEKNCRSFYDELAFDENCLNILALHGQLSSQKGEDMVDLKALAAKNIDYLALGHFHSFSQTPIDRRGTAVYSGCLEGRGFDETGEKGFVSVSAANRRLAYRFVPFCRRQVVELLLDLTGCESLAGLHTAFRQAVEGVSAQHIVRLTLVGEYLPSLSKNIAYLIRELRDRFFWGEVKDLSKMKIRYQDYENDISLKGAFVRQVLSMDYSPEDREAILSLGLNALRGETLEF